MLGRKFRERLRRLALVALGLAAIFTFAAAEARDLCAELRARCASPAFDCRSGLPGENRWALEWSDEFSGTGTLDPASWNLEQGGDGWWNNEDQFYTARAENVRQESGFLVIEARREPFEHRAYTSGRIQTRGKRDFTYGRFEARIRLPGGRGTWPAFWMLASNDAYSHPDGSFACNGEIDIMENVAFDRDRIHHYIHTEAYNHWTGTQRGFSGIVPGTTTEFHVYALEWLPDRLVYSVDGAVTWTYEKHGSWKEWPFDQDFFLLVNVAIGGWGGDHGIDDGAFPQRMEVDYLRVFAPDSPAMCAESR